MLEPVDPQALRRRMYGLLCERLGKLPGEVGDGMTMPEALELIEAWTEGAEKAQTAASDGGSRSLTRSSEPPRLPTTAELMQIFAR